MILMFIIFLIGWANKGEMDRANRKWRKDHYPHEFENDHLMGGPNR